MPFEASWHTLLDRCEEFGGGTKIATPLSDDQLRVTDVQEHRIVVEFSDTGETRSLQREQFETLHRRIQDVDGAFDLSRIPPGAEPYAAVLGVHPRFEIDDRAGTIVEHDEPPEHGATPDQDSTERSEPDLSVYADALLLIDALERHDFDAIEDVDTSVLVNLYTLLSDVQRGADDLRKEVTDVILDRLHHDNPVAGQYGSVQRTSRRRRSLRDETEVLETLEAAGIDRERVTGLDRDKVEDALEVTDLSEEDVFEIQETEYVRKADVDEDVKETRLQGLKDRLAASEDTEAEQLREEIEQLEARIEDLTEFKAGHQFNTTTGADP
jgi:hypothetical protein